MLALTSSQSIQVGLLAEQYRVRRLDLFGSAVRDDFDEHASDLDFVVEFEPLTPADAADRYFGLLHGLEDLFGRPVDLVSYKSIRNPYFKAVVDRTRTPLYAA